MKKEKNPRIIQKKCPKCGHHQIWGSRGILGTYFEKCSKCTYIKRKQS